MYPCIARQLGMERRPEHIPLSDRDDIPLLAQVVRARRLVLNSFRPARQTA